MFARSVFLYRYLILLWCFHSLRSYRQHTTHYLGATIFINKRVGFQTGAPTTPCVQTFDDTTTTNNSNKNNNDDDDDDVDDDDDDKEDVNKERAQQRCKSISDFRQKPYTSFIYTCSHKHTHTRTQSSEHTERTWHIHTHKMA